MLTRILLLIFGGTIFFMFYNWLILPIFAMAWFLFESKVVGRNMKLIKMAILVGIILMLFDFAFENWGAVYGYWRTINSYFFVLNVPIEIMLTCIFGGAAWFLFISKYKNKFLVATNTTLWSIGGMTGEYFLMTVGLMRYGNGWSSIPHAFVSYFLTFVLFFFISFYFNRKLERK
jgi:hypothetical protein